MTSFEVGPACLAPPGRDVVVSGCPHPTPVQPGGERLQSPAAVLPGQPLVDRGPTRVKLTQRFSKLAQSGDPAVGFADFAGIKESCGRWFTLSTRRRLYVLDSTEGRAVNVGIGTAAEVVAQGLGVLALWLGLRSQTRHQRDHTRVITDIVDVLRAGGDVDGKYHDDTGQRSSVTTARGGQDELHG